MFNVFRSSPQSNNQFAKILIPKWQNTCCSSKRTAKKQLESGNEDDEAAVGERETLQKDAQNMDECVFCLVFFVLFCFFFFPLIRNQSVY